MYNFSRLPKYSAILVELFHCTLRNSFSSHFFTAQKEANNIKAEASDLDKLIDRKRQDYDLLREDMKEKELEVQNLLEKGKTEQQVMFYSYVGSGHWKL